MKKLIFTIWGGHLLLCVLWLFVIAYLVALGLTHSSSPVSASIIFIATFLVVSFSYAVLGYKVNNDKYKDMKPVNVIWSVSIVCFVIFMLPLLNLSPYLSPFLVRLYFPYYVLCASIMDLVKIKAGLLTDLISASLPSAFMYLGYQIKNQRRRKIKPILQASEGIAEGVGPDE
ncbi:MAG: hypothetical protein FWD39_02400 [Clostridiales bacterium]|nr:hypothetical protein [Clostridiales bacterium]